MGIITRLLAPQPVAYAPTDDYWYKPVGQGSLAGVRVDPETALNVSAVWACVRLIAGTMARLPLEVYRWLPDDEREKAKDYYLYDVLRRKPNARQSAQEWKFMLTSHLLLRGNCYARIDPGGRGASDQLIPLHPGRVTPQWQDSHGTWHDDSTSYSVAPEADAPLRYKYRLQNGEEVTYSDAEIFHMRAFWTHGIRGLSVIEYARESIGLAMATEQYGARFFTQDTTPKGVLTHPGKLSDEGAKKLAMRWAQSRAGLNNAHGTAVLEEGMKWEPVGMTNEDAQFLLTRSFQIEDVARWFNVPLHMIQHSEKSTTWGTGIEQITLGFTKWTLGFWAAIWEDAISRDLIAQPDRYYAEFNFNDLERGDLKTRYEAYEMARLGGWMNGNDVRRRENMNMIAGPAGESYWRPANMVDANDPTPAEPAALPDLREPNGQANGHYLTLLHGCAERVIRKETSALSKLAKRHCEDNNAWCQAVNEFYAEHVDFVSQTLGISRRKAEAYCEEQRAMVLPGGAGALDDWGNERIPALIELVMGGNDGD